MSHNRKIYEWKRFHSYRIFDEFLESFVLRRKSYITQHSEKLNLQAAFEEIRKCFVADFDDSDARFEEKVTLQFASASEQTKIVFANVEYLWAMPMENISPNKKRSYSQRWFADADQLHSGENYFFGYPHIIADPGPWYIRNKYWEIVALLSVLSHVTKSDGFSDLISLKRKIAELSHSAVYAKAPPDNKFIAENFCGVHCALMHLADPERYESIISASHKKQICAVFGHIIENPSADVEILLKQIRSALYDSHGSGEDPDRKHRWFFYSRDVLPLWIDKKSKKQQRISAAVFDVRNEEDAVDLEGTRDEVTGLRIRRSAKKVKDAKVRDKYTCQACGFYFEDQIVHVHHLNPLSEYRRPQDTKPEDLVTLCPTCHYLAHYWLREDPIKFKELGPLLEKLKSHIK